VQSASIGLGGFDGSAILPGTCCGCHVGWLCLGLGDGVGGWVLCVLGNVGESLSGWGTALVLIGGLAGAFIWVETLAESSGWHREGCLQT
jgi:hypothetical protein